MCIQNKIIEICQKLKNIYKKTISLSFDHEAISILMMVLLKIKFIKKNLIYQTTTQYIHDNLAPIVRMLSMLIDILYFQFEQILTEMLTLHNMSDEQNFQCDFTTIYYFLDVHSHIKQ